MKLARTLRFDASDLNVFPKTAAEGEWAVVGSFVFAGRQPQEVTGKDKQAFANGFVGLPSFGFSTFVSISSADEQIVSQLTEQLAGFFTDEMGAPSQEVARKAATEELGFMAELCAEYEVGSLLALRREWTEDGFKEAFSHIEKAESCAEQQIWTIIEDEDTAEYPLENER